MVQWWWLIPAALAGYCLAWLGIFLWPEYLFHVDHSADSDDVTSQYDSTED